MEIMVIIRSFFALCISFLMTFYLVPLCIKMAYTFNILDNPDGKVKKHKQATPYLGGIALYLGFIISLAFTLPLENKINIFLVGSTVLLFLGLIDDLIVIKPYQKFFGQFIATFCFLKGGLYLKEGFFVNNIWSIPISCLWILTVTNAFNLVDIMDGLATTLALCATFSFLVLALMMHQSYMLIILLCALLGSLCAFLCYNKPIAKIYLGDTGSLFLGGFMATIPFLYTWGTYNPHGYIVPLIILAIPCLEVVSLVFIRSYKKIPFYRGSPDHFAHYLKQNGWSTRAILTYLIILSFILLVVALAFVLNVIVKAHLIILGVLFLGVWFLMLFCKNQKIPLNLARHH